FQEMMAEHSGAHPGPPEPRAGGDRAVLQGKGGQGRAAEGVVDTDRPTGGGRGTTRGSQVAPDVHAHASGPRLEHLLGHNVRGKTLADTPGVECRAFRKTDGLVAPVHNDAPGLSPTARGKRKGRLLPEVFKASVEAEGDQIPQDRRVEGPRGGLPSLEGPLDQLDGLGGDPDRPRGRTVQAGDLAVLSEP